MACEKYQSKILDICNADLSLALNFVDVIRTVIKI